MSNRCGDRVTVGVVHDDVSYSVTLEWDSPTGWWLLEIDPPVSEDSKRELLHQRATEQV